MATRAGAAFGPMHHGWWNQQVLEAADDYANSVLDVWSVPGDSMLMVNRFGVRAVGEKREYESRGRVHHIYEHDEYVNRLMFMVYDSGRPGRYGGRYPIPPDGAVADHVVSATGVDGLAAASKGGWRQGSVADALRHRASRPGAGLRLELASPSSGSTPWPGRRRRGLRPGHPAGRGRLPRPPAEDNQLPNPLMYPLDTQAGCSPSSSSGAPSTPTAGRASAPRDRSWGGRADPRSLRGRQLRRRRVRRGVPGGGSTIGPGMVFGSWPGPTPARRSPQVAAR